MKHVIVQYRVKPERVEHNQALVRAVYEELGATRPDAFRYVTFKLLDDGVSFVHLASVETADGRGPLPSVAAFRAFQEGIAERCDQPPVASEAVEIGSYRMFGG